jgi:hypothetical protein
MKKEGNGILSKTTVDEVLLLASGLLKRFKKSMKTLLAILLWFVLFALCWPLALFLLFALPVIWLLLLPFKIIGFSIEMIFKLIRSILMLPFRLLGLRA